jgi:hypothetical protein
LFLDIFLDPGAIHGSGGNTNDHSQCDDRWDKYQRGIHLDTNDPKLSDRGAGPLAAERRRDGEQQPA